MGAYVDVRHELEACEVAGKDVPIGTVGPMLGIENHWNLSKLVVLDFDGTRLTVSIKGLMRALENVENAFRR